MHLKTSRVAAVSGASLLLVLLLVPGTALAHERRTIANGKYDVVVGWNGEPPYAGQMNQATIRVMEAGSTTPVSGADKSLKLAIRQGASTQAFPLKAAFGQNGFYTADIMPTRVGDYQWISPATSTATLSTKLSTPPTASSTVCTRPLGFNFRSHLADPAQNVASIQAAQADAQSARTLALIGIVVGVVGLLVGVGAWLMRPRAASAPAPSTRPASERV